MNLDAIKKLIEAIQMKIAELRGEVRKTINNQPRTIPSLPDPIYIFLHHGGGDWNLEKVNNHHKDLWGMKSSLGYYIGYNAWLEDGKITQTRRDNEEGAHTVGSVPNYYNRTGTALGVKGDYTYKLPSEVDLQKVKEWIDEKKKKYSIPNSRILGHREVAKTNCPGQKLFEWLAQNYPN